MQASEFQYCMPHFHIPAWICSFYSFYLHYSQSQFKTSLLLLHQNKADKTVIGKIKYDYLYVFFCCCCLFCFAQTKKKTSYSFPDFIAIIFLCELRFLYKLDWVFSFMCCCGCCTVLAKKRKKKKEMFFSCFAIARFLFSFPGCWAGCGLAARFTFIRIRINWTWNKWRVTYWEASSSLFCLPVWLWEWFLMSPAAWPTERNTNERPNVKEGGVHVWEWLKGGGRLGSSWHPHPF